MGRRIVCAALVLTPLVVTSAGFAQVIDNKVMHQPDSPIEITALASEFGGRDNNYVIFEARYRNTSDRFVIGIKFGFIAYDLFNESLGGISGVDVNRKGIGPGGDDSGRWQTRARGVALAHDVGIAYVQKVRFSDGELWIADRDSLNEALQEMVPGGSASLLEDADQ